MHTHIGPEAGSFPNVVLLSSYRVLSLNALSIHIPPSHMDGDNDNLRCAFPPENAKCDCSKADSHITSGVFGQLATTAAPRQSK